MALLGRGCAGVSSALYLRFDSATTPVQLASTCRASSSQSSGRARRVAVIGGGFVGLSCALHLQRAGHTVVLLDSAALAGPASASFGNAGPPLPKPTCCLIRTVPRAGSPLGAKPRSPTLTVPNPKAQPPKPLNPQPQERPGVVGQG